MPLPQRSRRMPLIVSAVAASAGVLGLSSFASAITGHSHASTTIRGSSTLESTRPGSGASASAGEHDAASKVRGLEGKGHVFLTSAPNGLNAVVGDSQVSLTWSAPSDPTAPVPTGYEIRTSADGGTTWTVAADNVATTSFTVTGLTNGSAYAFDVLADISTGLSDPSSPVDATPAATPVPPAAPTNLKQDADDDEGSGTMKLSWSAPANSGSAPVTGYQIQVSTDGGATWTTAAVQVTATTIQLPYQSGELFQVAAESSAGAGAFATFPQDDDQSEGGSTSEGPSSGVQPTGDSHGGSPSTGTSVPGSGSEKSGGGGRRN